MRSGWARWGSARCGVLCYVTARHGRVRHGRLGTARPCAARSVGGRLGSVWHGSHGLARIGLLLQGPVRVGTARRVLARQARYRSVCRGLARHGSFRFDE